MTSQCPNEFPTTSAAYRIALCGESPGEREVALHRPFVGAAGAHLDRMLAGAGILRSACFVGNVSQVRPPGNEFSAFEWGSAEVQDGIEALLADLTAFAPNLVVTLGNVPLHLFRMGNVNTPRNKRGGKLAYDWPSKVTTWRGSLFMSSPRAWEQNARRLAPSPEVVAACSRFGRTEPRPQMVEEAGATPAACSLSITGKPIENPASAPQAPVAAGASPALAATVAAVETAAVRGENAAPEPDLGPAPPSACAQWKCLATLHPAYCLRAWSENFNLRQDLRRARAEGETTILVLPELDFQYGP